MSAGNKLSKAKTQLLLGEPFFASIAMGMDYVADTSIKTANTNGKRVAYNPDFVEQHDLDEVAFTLAHEVMHVSQMHHLRQGHRDGKKWNKACDYAINPILQDCGFKVIEGALLDDQYKNMSAEQIYNMLPDEPEEEGGGEGDGDPGGCGGVEPPPDAKSQADKTIEEDNVREMVDQAMNNARKQGKLPAWLERVIQLGAQPKVDWKEVLARFLSDIVHNDYSFSKPNSRYLHTGFYLPALENEEVGDIIMIVDTSGSINEELLDKFGVEMQEVCNSFGKGFKVIYVDAKVQGTQDIEPDGPVQLHAHGGGGTDFRPGFEWLDEQGITPKALVYFTDGICWDFPETPDYEVLWALYGTHDFQPPFGEVVNITDI